MNLYLLKSNDSDVNSFIKNLLYSLHDLKYILIEYNNYAFQMGTVYGFDKRNDASPNSACQLSQNLQAI